MNAQPSLNSFLAQIQKDWNKTKEKLSDSPNSLNEHRLEFKGYVKGYFRGRDWLNQGEQERLLNFLAELNSN